MYIEMNKTELQKHFLEKLLDTNRGYDYYVNWNNVVEIEKYDVQIYALDCLLKCTDDEKFYNKFKTLLSTLPSVVEVFPYLFALSRDERQKVTNDQELKIIKQDIDSSDYDSLLFNGKKDSMSVDEIDNYYTFFVSMGLKNLFQNLLDNSVHDYITGVLVGLDSNGRKNRGGSTFEQACEPFIRKLCEQHNLDILVQKKFKILEDMYGLKVSDAIKDRKTDFILVDKVNHKYMNIEVDFFNSNGSKPQEIINSYSDRQQELNEIGISFCLITDGKCWEKASNQLKVGLNKIKYLMNYRLAKEGMLEEAIEKEFK